MSLGLSSTDLLGLLVDKSVDRQTSESLDRYVDTLRNIGVERGLIGPREVDRIWVRHILNCAPLAPLLPPRSSVADLGSGAGLPGVVLAILRADVTFTLVEPMLRRADFLREVVDTLGLTNTSVLRERAEDHGGPLFDVVVARAVAPLDRLWAWALALLRPGGTLVAMKGRQATAELEQHREGLERLGVHALRVERLGQGVLAEPTTVVLGRRRGGRRTH